MIFYPTHSTTGFSNSKGGIGWFKEHEKMDEFYVGIIIYTEGGESIYSAYYAILHLTKFAPLNFILQK